MSEYVTFPGRPSYLVLRPKITMASRLRLFAPFSSRSCYVGACSVSPS